jgi:hypothetical protein
VRVVDGAGGIEAAQLFFYGGIVTGVVVSAAAAQAKGFDGTVEFLRRGGLLLEVALTQAAAGCRIVFAEFDQIWRGGLVPQLMHMSFST